MCYAASWDYNSYTPQSLFDPYDTRQESNWISAYIIMKCSFTKKVIMFGHILISFQPQAPRTYTAENFEAAVLK